MKKIQNSVIALAMIGGVTIGATTAAGAGSCTIVGTNGPDVLVGTSGADVICALGGDDTITGLDGNDVVYGGPGNDTIDGGPGDDALWGKEGDDTINGGDGNDRIGGDIGNDNLNGGDGDDRINGADGDDFITGGMGSDRLYGDNGEDTLLASDSSDPNGQISQDSSANVLGGGAGWDVLIGSNGDDILYFGTDGGRAAGLEGNDRLVGPTSTSTDDSHVVMFGGLGDDVLIANKAGFGSGRDVSEFKDPVTSDRIASYFDGGGGFDVVYGSPFDDYIEGAVGRIDARGGNDTLQSVGGLVLGRDGDDYISATDGDDTIFGGDGNDFLLGGRGADTLGGGPGADFIAGSGFVQSDGGNTIWTGDDSDIDTVNAVDSDRCFAGRIDVVEGVCTP